ncbi:OmpA family protein [Salidesulfovibrio onnuriiensis]|uniref:OmpA family protein n=1 Tax=Salidesulfovibrio onnuriiensis TaxID=2583823 RepID=UPI0011CB70F3|nr:OmpA family protein [Salidesulfovibrio onnuriiensis]
MSHRKQITKTALLLALVVMFAFPAIANAANMVPKIDNFIFFVDQSGSMAQAHKTLGTKKLDMAKDTLARMNKKIPALSYNSALFLFAPFEAKLQPAKYNKAAMCSAIAGINSDLGIFNRLTPMGDGLMDVDPVISGMQGKTALIIFTDGASNIGADPIAQAKALYAKYGDRLCIHVVSFADTDAGQMVIDEIRGLSGCTVPADVSSLSDDAAMAKYVQDVFYGMAEAPMTPEGGEVITFDLHFGFDKYQITDEMIPILEQAKMILEENSAAAYIIEGHTDWTGTDQYNQGLSERRANSVKKWLIDNGIGSGRLQSIGYGELKPKFDNSTKEGRRLNRRVEIHTK